MDKETHDEPRLDEDLTVEDEGAEQVIGGHTVSVRHNVRDNVRHNIRKA